MTSAARFRAFLLAGCALLVVALWLAQVNPYLNPADDSGRYMVLGESLARRGQFRLINDVRAVRDTLYVPGLPAVIAFWLKVTGSDPGGVVLPVKATLLLLLLGTLPLMLTLLERAGLRRPTIAAAMITYAACPALVSYANEVMSEMPLLFLCLASIVVATRASTTRSAGTRPILGAPETGTPAAPTQYPIPNTQYQLPSAFALSLALAVAAYYVRAAGAVLLLSLVVWFWRSRGWRWGATALAVALFAISVWQVRSSRIIAQDGPSVPHDTYMKQFTLKNPDDPGAGRIQMNALGIASRIRRCFPPNVANMHRSVLYSMGTKGSAWQALFYLIAAPFTCLAIYGWLVAWRRKMVLVCGFCVLFWLFIALWPWVNPRFLIPLVPYILLFAFAGAEALGDAFSSAPAPLLRAAGGVGLALLLVYFARVHAVVIAHEHARTLPGYALGRTRDEAGFYAAAAWLKGREPGTVVMARPAYLMHLYSGHPTTQIEPNTSPRVQEKAYMLRNHVRYLVADRWTWAHTENYVAPYLHAYADQWTLAWQDPGGSGVRIYRRNEGSQTQPGG